MVFAVIYRWKVTSGQEAKFERIWGASTQIIYSTFGSLGSSLHRDEHGEYVAYARWPDKKSWERMVNDYESTTEIEEFWERNVREIAPPMCLDLRLDLLQKTHS